MQYTCKKDSLIEHKYLHYYEGICNLVRLY